MSSNTRARRSDLVTLAVAAAPVASAEPATAAEAGFVDIRSVIPDAVVDLRYATADNFVGKPLYPADARCLVHSRWRRGSPKPPTRSAARGAKLVFWDCYRPHDVQVEMFEAVPDPNWVARPGTSARSHESGRSVDVTLADGALRLAHRHGHRLRRLLPARKGFRHRRRHRRSSRPTARGCATAWAQAGCRCTPASGGTSTAPAPTWASRSSTSR